MLNLEEIKAREQAATKGPWEIGGDIEHLVCAEENPEKYDRPPIVADCGNLYSASNSGQVWEMQKNADFIAHARTDIPALIEQHEQDEQQIATLKKALEMASTYIVTLGMCDDHLCDDISQEHHLKYQPKNDGNYENEPCIRCVNDYYVQQAQEGQK